MKIQNTDEHAEFQDMGDPIPTIPERVTKRRRRPQLLTLLVIAALVLSSFSALNTFGALRAVFPNSQVFSVRVAYSFANSAGQVLLPGGVGNVTLTINSAVAQPTTLYLSYNATDPGDWSSDSSNTGQCDGYNGPLTMSLGSVQRLAPVNTPLTACPVESVAVTVNQGVNTFRATITVSPTATISGVFQLSWFASQ